VLRYAKPRSPAQELTISVLTCFACFTYLFDESEQPIRAPSDWQPPNASVKTPLLMWLAHFDSIFPNQLADLNQRLLMATVEERVIDIVSEQLGVDKDKINLDTSFVNDLGADSLDTVELVMELEEEFDISIPDESAEKIQKVGEAVSFIETAKGDDA
jgi:acyl carrier protein